MKVMFYNLQLIFQRSYQSLNSETKEIPISGSEVKDSLIDAMNVLGQKYDFSISYAPAKGFDNLVKNVRR